MYTKSVRTLLFLFMLLITACNFQPSNKEEVNQIEYLNEKIESLTQALNSNLNNNQEEREENIRQVKLLEWRIDSIEKTQKLNDSLNAYHKVREEANRDTIRILQCERDSLVAIKNAHRAPMLVNGNNTTQSIQSEEHLSLTQTIAQKDLLIAQQNEKIRLDSLEIDSIKRLNQKEINKNNPEVKAMQANIITQMNYCILTSYYIKNSPSLEYFENKKLEVNNYLTQESIKGIKDVHDYRQEIRETLDELIINEHEKQIYFDVLDIEKKNRKLNAAKNALQVPQLSVNPFSAIANTVLTIARAGIDLAVSKNEAEIQSIRSMWEFQRVYLKNEFQLVRKGFDYISLLYDKYDLKEYDRLTERDIEKYFSALSEPNPETRTRKLEYDSLVFKNLHDYYYNLGMAYIEADSTYAGYKRAEPYFDRYIEQYNKYPLYRTDEKTGIIALTRLLRGKDTSNEYKTILIKEIEKNLPDNEFGYAVGCMEYYTMGDYKSAFMLLQKGIDMIVNDEVLIEIALKYMNDIRKYPEIHRKICGAILLSRSLTLQQYAACVIAMNNNERNERLGELLRLNPYNSSSLYLTNKELRNIKFEELKNKIFNEKDVEVYHESVTDTNVYIYEYDMRPFGISKEELLGNAKLFNKNDDIIPFFFEEADSNGKPTYYIKTPFDKTLFHGNSDKYLLIRGKLNTIDYTHQQNDSLLKVLIRYCADLSTYREELLFSNNYIKKIDTITNSISKLDTMLKILNDSTKTLKDKADFFRVQAESLKSEEKNILNSIESNKKRIKEVNHNKEELVAKYNAKIAPIKKRIKALEIANENLDVTIEDYDSATNWKKAIAWAGGKREDNLKYDRNKKEIKQLQSSLDTEEQKFQADYNKLVKNIEQLQSSLNTEEQKQKSIHDEYEDALAEYNSINKEHSEINTNAIEEEKEKLKKELENLYVKKDNIYFYGNRPMASKLEQYNDTNLINLIAPEKENERIAYIKKKTGLDVLSVEVVKVDSIDPSKVILKIYYEYKFHNNIEIGDYLKVFLGEDNGSFGKVVLTYKKDGDKWIFYASEMFDGTKYKLAQ